MNEIYIYIYTYKIYFDNAIKHLLQHEHLSIVMSHIRFKAKILRYFKQQVTIVFSSLILGLFFRKNMLRWLCKVHVYFNEK